MTLRRVPSWRLLLSCFAVIVLIFVTTKLVTWARGRALHASIERAMNDALTAAELVSRLGRDLEGERALFDTHILERQGAAMTRIEARLDELDRDFEATAQSYAPLADDPEERRVWRALQSDVLAVKPQVAAVLAASRADRDLEARTALSLVDAHYARIMEDVGRLVTLNRVGVTRALAALDRDENDLNFLIGALALAGIVLTAFGGAAAMRLVHRRERELVQQSTLLQERNRELDAFAGRVAHDLRGPLTSMRLAVWRIVKQLPEGAAPTAAAERAIERMDILIRDLLSLSRVETRAHDGVCDPARVAAGVEDDLSPRVAAAAGSLRIEVEPARVRCTEGLLTEALINLADNALKYCRPDEPPRVALTGRAVGPRYELRVADNGIGMSMDETRQAFAPFYRARRDPSAPGSGLGLSIVKRIAEASGGDVAIDSALGQGTTFVLHFPLA
ncbi:MAG TPA: ATP-binding protein [Polyangia bacterium]|jgi:signal transduction histidine kinase